MKAILISGMLLGLTVAAAAQEITVAAAADLSFALKEIAANYRAKTGTAVRLTFGSSGNLVTAIENGAPYDVFFSADRAYAEKLVSDGKAAPDTMYEYAVGRLVLWAPAKSPIDVDAGLKALTDARVRKIAIANPAHAPYGRAAEQALRAAGIYDQVNDKLVLGENISQTAQFVESGNADVGLLALALVVSNHAGAHQAQGKYWVVPASLYRPILQAAVAVKGPREDAAKRFLDYIKSDAARAVLKRYGFDAAP